MKTATELTLYEEKKERHSARSYSSTFVIEAETLDAKLNLTVSTRDPSVLRSVSELLLTDARGEYSFDLSMTNVTDLLSSHDEDTELLRRLATAWTAAPKIPYLTAIELAKTDWMDPLDPYLPGGIFLPTLTSEDLRRAAKWVEVFARGDDDVVFLDAEVPARTDRLFTTAFSRKNREAFEADPSLREIVAKTLDAATSPSRAAVIEALALRDVKTLLSLDFDFTGPHIPELLALVREERLHVDPKVMKASRSAEWRGLAVELLSSQGFSDEQVLELIPSKHNRFSERLGRFLLYTPTRSTKPTVKGMGAQPDLYVMARIFRLLGVNQGLRVYVEILDSPASYKTRVSYALSVTPESPPLSWLEALE